MVKNLGLVDRNTIRAHPTPQGVRSQTDARLCSPAASLVLLLLLLSMRAVVVAKAGEVALANAASRRISRRLGFGSFSRPVALAVAAAPARPVVVAAAAALGDDLLGHLDPAERRIKCQIECQFEKVNNYSSIPVSGYPDLEARKAVIHPSGVQGQIL